MSNNEALKEMVREKYSQIALQPQSQNAASCCGATSCCSTEVYNIMADSYESLEGYAPEADLGLGCGLPTEFAKIKAGDTVIDLGSGAGNDAFVARAVTGETGKVIGVDFTPAMIALANQNAEKLGYNNVQFRLGDIDDMPITSSSADVVVSNCVLNLVPNKHKVFSEIYRVLKPGAHFSISDIVLHQSLPERLSSVAELYAGCVSGAILKSEYLSIIEQSGFMNVTIQREKAIVIPEEILTEYASDDELPALRDGIVSISVYAEKPAKDERNCCTPGAGCC